MEFQDGHRLKLLAKTFLSDQEYSRFFKTLKVFFKKERMGVLCREMMQFVKTRERTDLLIEVRQLLPKDKRSEFSRICRNLVADKQTKAVKRLPLEDQECNGNHVRSTVRSIPGTNKIENPKTDRSIVIIMERDSLRDNFGFKISGDLFTEREIVVGQLDRNSIADLAGLREGHRIISINETDCIRARKADIIKLVKAAERLHVVVDTRKVRKTKSRQIPAIKYVTVHDDVDGRIGCCIRGGTDYVCDVHITLVEHGSPAERAGIRKGDIITEVNGVPLYGKTHIQAVDAILTTCPPITFTIKTTCKGISDYPRSTQMSSQERANGLPAHTPLMMSNHRQSTGTRTVHNSVYMNQNISVQGLPLHTLCLEDIPPPPYTAELPDTHRVLQRADSCYNTTETANMVLPIENAVLNEDLMLELSVYEGETIGTGNHGNNSAVLSTGNQDSMLESVYEGETIGTRNHGNTNAVLTNGNGAVAGNIVESHFSNESNASVTEMHRVELSVGYTADKLAQEDNPPIPKANKTVHEFHDNFDDAASKPESENIQFDVCGISPMSMSADPLEINEANPSQELEAGEYSQSTCSQIENFSAENNRIETKQTSLLDDIRNFNQAKLKRAKPRTTPKLVCDSDPRNVGVPGIPATRKKSPVARMSSEDDLLIAINVALEKRARAFNSSCRSCNESYESGNEWEDM